MGCEIFRNQGHFRSEHSDDEDHLTPFSHGPIPPHEKSRSQPHPLTLPMDNHGQNRNNSQAANQVAAPVLNYIPDPRNVPAKHSTVKMKPDAYDGSEDFDDYEEHFSGIAILNGWDYRIKSLMLSSMLRGSARSFYLTLPGHIRSDYFQLVDQLKGRFGGMAKHPQFWVSQFNSRNRKTGESAAKFADAIYLLARRAYPAGMTDFNLQQVALQQFYKSLDPEMKWKCIEKGCTELRQAVEVVEMYETFMGNHATKKSIREVNATNDLLLNIVDRIDQLQAEQERNMIKLSNCNATEQINPAHNPNQSDKTHGQTPTRNYHNQRNYQQYSQPPSQYRRCFGCGNKFHVLRECPHFLKFQEQDKETQLSGNRHQPTLSGNGSKPRQ